MLRNPLRDETDASWGGLRGETVLVNLKSGNSLRGTVWATHGGHVELRDVTIIAGERRLEQVAEIRFAASEADFYQVIHRVIAGAEALTGPRMVA